MPAPGIGIVGAGSIVRSAHLPAYTKRKFPVVAICDREISRAEALAREFAIPEAYGNVRELLAHPGIGIVDVAVPPAGQPEIARLAMAAGKHLLCQKPLAETYEAARALVEEAQSAGVKLAVNQQMRWDPLIRATRDLLRSGRLGQPVNVTLQVSVWTAWETWSWIPDAQRLDLLLHSIHYFDSLRFLFGEPEWVFSALGKYPGQKEAAETRSLTTLSFPGGLLAQVAVSHKNWADDPFAAFRLEGTDGIVRGTFGHLYDYPVGRPDTMEYRLRSEAGWHSVEFQEKWFPDAFASPMSSLMEAIRSGGEPETSGRDHLDTLALVFAAYGSAQERRAVSLR